MVSEKKTGSVRKCHGEHPVVYEATGATFGEALRRLAKHKDLREDVWAHGAVSVVPDVWADKGFVATLFVS